MKVKFSAILTISAALEAVKRNGDALRYVLLKDLFASIASKLSIDIEM